ncbi:MAG TPA: tetratricopeptide repeat protein [Vicinamibacterales bacterium]|jgi:tetratricopeptide (TPR) repeat protein|nr:tetratricopeptide repeat protein [Vicinamibacterales bacterium]
MKSDAIAFGIAGVLFGLIAGWIIGSQQAVSTSRPAAAPAAQQAPGSAPSGGSANTRAALLDEARVNALRSVASREPSNATPRLELGNLYFDAERFDDAIKWYEEAVKLAPNDVNLHTDLGVSYYYVNQPDKALEQFSRSLQLDPKHAKTLLNLGIVKAFGKQDLQGASEAWQQVIKLAPDSPEGQAAKRALDSLQSAHPGTGRGAAGAPGSGDTKPPGT